MRTVARSAIACAAVAIASTVGLSAGAIDPALQRKIDAEVKNVQAWAADPVIVSAVKAHNASAPADHAAMTQDKWASLTVLDPFIRSFSKNEAGTLLKTKKSVVISEAFLSDASGVKVAFLAKPTNWSHKGKPKHDVPMTGKVWQGSVEVDESTGSQQIQIAVPVMDGSKAIGSLVVGLSISKLGQ